MTILDRFYECSFNEDALLLDKIRDDTYNYDVTPIGAKVFASMGVDGVHYCIVPKNDDITLENSPIYRVSPMDFSEGTIIWTAKNFYDFISVSIELKDFWALPCLIGLEKDEFLDLLESYKYEFEVKEENEKKSILDNMKILTKYFQPIKIPNIYEYVKESYSDKNNHVELKFTIPDIVEDKLGLYHIK